jgi:hypothetical protein
MFSKVSLGLTGALLVMAATMAGVALASVSDCARPIRIFPAIASATVLGGSSGKVVAQADPSADSDSDNDSSDSDDNGKDDNSDQNGDSAQMDQQNEAQQNSQDSANDSEQTPLNAYPQQQVNPNQ